MTTNKSTRQIDEIRVNWLAECRERASQATPGEWIATPADGRQNARVLIDDGTAICTVWDRGKKENRYFIAHAREDIPRLLALVDEQQALLEERERVIEQAIRFTGVHMSQESGQQLITMHEAAATPDMYPDLATYLKARTTEAPIGEGEKNAR